MGRLVGVWGLLLVCAVCTGASTVVTDVAQGEELPSSLLSTDGSASVSSTESLVSGGQVGEVASSNAGLSGEQALAAERASRFGSSGSGSVEEAGGGSRPSAGTVPVSSPSASVSLLSLSSGSLSFGSGFTQAEALWAEEEARRASPEAVVAREESESAFSALGPRESEELALHVFPGLVEKPAGGMPALPAGERLLSFASEFAAALALPDGQHGVLESSLPIAVSTASGLVPVNLTPRQAGSGFEASTPPAGMYVHIGGRLSEGASLSDVGVTLTPVTADGMPLEGTRALAGASVLYADSEDPQAGISDVDSLVKLDPNGFSEDAILRSQKAPQKLYFRVGLPVGASLIKTREGIVDVVAAGQTVAQISASVGRDAEGTLVPLSVSLGSAGVIVVGVPHEPGQFRLPIEVDPAVLDIHDHVMRDFSLTFQDHWKVDTSNGKEGPFHFWEPSEEMADYHREGEAPEYHTAEWGGFSYEAQGESAVYRVVMTSRSSMDYDDFENRAQIVNKKYTGKNESPLIMQTGPYLAEKWEPCILSRCAVPGEVTPEIAENAFHFTQYATTTASRPFETGFHANVYIVQTKNSTVSLDTTDEKVDGLPNALYGNEHWVNWDSEVKGIAKDPGIGISEVEFWGPTGTAWKHSESFMYPASNTCKGVVCPQEESYAASLRSLPDGKDTVTFAGQNATDTKAQAATVSATVYVDNTSPHNIALLGIGASKEIGNGEYKLSAEATDGSGSTPSSGMKSMTLLIDGKEIGSVPASCTPGPCTAHSGTWTVFGRGYATGQHTLTVLATDNTGNTSSEAFTMDVHPASPVTMGPGAVDPVSGEMTISSTDVSMGGGLTVNRSYGSQHLKAGESGPLSAQWGFSLGGQESLVKQPDGSMVLTNSSGAQTIFAPDGKGGYVSPKGDSNLALSDSPCEAGQNEFELQNAAAATTTCFKVPAGGTSEVWMPSIAKGAVATNTVTYAFQDAWPHQPYHEYGLPSGSKPSSVTVSPDNNIWFTEEGVDKIGKITTSGSITEYALPEGDHPGGITDGPDGNLWYTNETAGKIGKITTSGVMTEYALPGKSAWSITTGPDGNLWFTGAALIGKITTSGLVSEYALPVLSKPKSITAGPDGNVWFTNDSESTLKATIDKITTSGSMTEYPISGAGAGIVAGPDGNLWFANADSKIGKITTSGSVTEYALPNRSWPGSITTGPEGNLWFTDEVSSKVGSITTSGAVTEFEAGTNSEPKGIVTGPDKNLWFAERATSKIGMIAPREADAKARIEPTEALAPVPAGVSCSPELKPGCRALTFNYAESTTATGEASSEWGDVNGLLTRAYYTAYDPYSEAMKTVEVAHYLYDSKKRLRTVWDPRVSPALKTTYGYDSEGHVTAVTAPGQESWAITYGTISGDGSSGRVLKVDQAPASSALWAGQQPSSDEAPKISGSAIVDNRMTVSDGAWSGAPVSYGYQWEDCSASGRECEPISGATNANYTPMGSDLGHTLVVAVTATNGGGSLTAASVPSGVVASSIPASSGYTQTVDSSNSLNAVSCVPQTSECVLSDSAGKAFYATNVSASGAASWSAWTGPGTSPSEALSCPATSLCLMAAGSDEGYGGNLYYATSLGGAWTTAYSPGYGVDAISCASSSFCVDGQDSEGYFRYSASPASTGWILEDQGSAAMKGVFCLSSSFCVLADSAGNVHVATTTTQIESSSWTETNVDGTSALNGITCTSTTSCVAVDGAGNILDLSIASNGAATVTKQNLDANSLVAIACPGSSVCVTLDSQGNVFISADGSTSWTKHLALSNKPTSVSCPSASLCVVADTAGKVTSFDPLSETVPAYLGKIGIGGFEEGQFYNPWDIATNSAGDVYVADSFNNRVQEFTPEGTYLRQWGSEGTGNGQLDNPEGIAVDSQGNVWVSDSSNNRIEEFTAEGAFVKAFGTEGSGNGQLKLPDGLEIDAAGDVWVADHGNSRIEEFSSEGAFIRTIGSYGSEQGKLDEPGDVSIDRNGELVVADTWNHRIEQFTTSGQFVRSFGGYGTGYGQFKQPWRASVGPEGNIWVSDTENDRVQVFSETGEYLYQFGSSESMNGPSGVAFHEAGIYELDRGFGSECVEMWLHPGYEKPTPGESRSPQPGSTIEYNVPLSGSGRPNMKSAEVERWAQKDVPTEATAVFPPDSPQGWPAFSYTRATIYYRDSTDRTVNVATPGGAISTTEYNEHNDVTRSLSADNRATALNETKPAEVAKLLDTQSEYNTEGTELLSTLGPRHYVKLTNGKKLQARSHTVYSYDEGAPAEGGPYRLVTKMTQGALTESEGEQDVRTTVTSYSGQNGLGWTLRKPTAVTTDPGGLNLTRRTVYDPATGNVVETRAPGAPAALPRLRYLSSWGSYGLPAIDRAEGVAIDKEGDIWIADTENNRIIELWSGGTEVRRTFGSFGSGKGQFDKPGGIALDPSGNVWVADTDNNRIQEFTDEGTFIRAIGSLGEGNGQFEEPHGIAVDSTGHVWVADTDNNRIQELTSEGSYMLQYGTAGVGNEQFKQPRGIAIDKEGNIWVADTGNGRVQELSHEGVYVRQFGRGGNPKPCEEKEGKMICQGSWPYGIALSSSGDVWTSEWWKVEEFSSTGAALGHFGASGRGEGQFANLQGLALDHENNVWLADFGNSRMQEVSSAGSFIRQYPAAETPSTFNDPKAMIQTSTGNWLISDTDNNRVQEVSGSGILLRQSFWQAEKTEGIAVDPENYVWFSGDSSEGGLMSRETESLGPLYSTSGPGSIRLDEPAGMAFSGKNMYIADSGSDRIVETKEYTNYLRQFGTAGSGNGQLSKPHGIAIDKNGNVWVADTGNNRMEEFSGEGAYIQQFGTAGSGNGQLSKPQGVTVGSEGNIWVADTGNNRVQVFSTSGAYIQQFGGTGTGAGQMKEPTDVQIDSSKHVYVLDAGNNRVQTWLDEGETEYPPSTHATQTIYYTTAANSKYSGCGGHPEWANLPCQIQPGAQPNTPGIANLPVTTLAYNMYGQPAMTMNSVSECVKVAPGTGNYTTGSCTTSGIGEYETKTNARLNEIAYDQAGRLISSETRATAGQAIPTITDKYSETTGALIEQSTASETLKSTYNNSGQLTSYTDADGNTTDYEYENGGDARLIHIDDGKGTQTYTYDGATGTISKLTDSAAGTFTASYDVEGNLIGESYPNAMSANLTLNPAGQVTGVQYIKTADCAKTCPETWYSDTVVPSIHGQWLSQTSSQATNAYVYDAAGRLVEGQDTPAGKGCVTRIYAYDEETNRLSLTTRQPGTGGACATTGGQVESHTYDSANRLTDAGTVYDPFGNTAKLPATDAGGTELSSSFYANNQLQSEEQAGQTVGDQLDPAGRVREIVSTGKITATEIQHYTGPGASTPAWTGELSSNYTRYTTGIGGTLVAIQHNGETPVLQLANLHGDVVATASDSESATSLASTVQEASDYGVPATEAPSKYSWLGAHQMPTTLPSGTIGMGMRSYIPQLGRFLQEDPIPGGSVNAYAYTNGDPINSFDLTGAYTWGFSESLTNQLDAQGQEIIAREAAREQASREEAERLAAQQAAQAEMYAAIETESPEEEWEEEEAEEYGAEYAAFGPGPGTSAPHLTEAEAAGVYVQPLAEGQQPATATPVQTVANLARLCEGELHGDTEVSQRSACSLLVDLCSGAFGGCGQLVKQGHVYGSIRHGRITLRRGRRVIVGVIKVTGGALGMAAGGFSFAACAVLGGEVDLAAHCVLGPGIAFSASLILAGAGLRELFG